jgi:tetratricopeptide (TPR) repeat protein
MKTVKKWMLMIIGLIIIHSMNAQTIEQGKKLVYCERYKSAKDIFQKILSTDPNNDEASYWLGQCMILPDERTPKDIADTKALYQTKLAANNSNLLIAGIGHIELLEGKIQDARNHFEAAISLSQGKSIAVLNAVGFANGNPDAKNGDAMYAIEKLNQAKATKKFNDPDVLVNLGDAYRKAGDGGNAILTYQAALAINPNYARANYRIGRIYQSQGRSQESIFMEYYDKAIASDPTFAPVYLTLSSFNYETNVTKAAEYFDKWLANTDEDEKSCYYRASLKFAQGLFLEAISKCDECIAAGGSNPYPSIYGLKANAYSKLKDSVKVIECYAEYFKRQASDKVVSADYLEYAKNLLKIPGNEVEAGLFIDKAVAMDSIEKNKVDYLKSVAQIYEGQKKFRNAAQWYMKILAIKRNPGKVDLYNAGYNFFRGGGYDSSILVFNTYTEKFPEDIFGNYMIAKSNAAIDTSGNLGLAVPYYIKAIEIGEKEADKSKVKDKLMGSYQYLIEYYYNKVKDQANALIYADKALLLDPNDAQMINNRDFISKNDPKAAPKKPSTNKQVTKP